MKMTIEIDCTPVEARAFLGLPDVSALNEHLVKEMQDRMTSNMAMLAPEELMKNWMAFGALTSGRPRKARASTGVQSISMVIFMIWGSLPRRHDIVMP